MTNQNDILTESCKSKEVRRCTGLFREGTKDFQFIFNFQYDEILSREMSFDVTTTKDPEFDNNIMVVGVFIGGAGRIIDFLNPNSGDYEILSAGFFVQTFEIKFQVIDGVPEGHFLQVEVVIKKSPKERQNDGN